MCLCFDYLPALEEKGLYYQYYDESHDNGDYGEKYFDKYLEKQPRSINVICDKALSRFNKNKIDEALEYGRHISEVIAGLGIENYQSDEEDIDTEDEE